MLPLLPLSRDGIQAPHSAGDWGNEGGTRDGDVLVSQCHRNYACLTWAQGYLEPSNYITSSADHPQVHPQSGRKQCQPPQLTFSRLEAGSAAQSAQQQHHCDIPYHSPNEGTTLGPPKPFLPH